MWLVPLRRHRANSRRRRWDLFVLLAATSHERATFVLTTFQSILEEIADVTSSTKRRLDQALETLESDAAAAYAVVSTQGCDEDIQESWSVWLDADLHTEGELLKKACRKWYLALVLKELHHTIG